MKETVNVSTSIRRKLFFFLLLAADVVVGVGGSEGEVRVSHFTTDTSLTH